MHHGKQYAVPVLNPAALRDYFRYHRYTPEQASPEELDQELKLLQKKRKKGLLWTLVCIVLMFSLIFVTVFLAGSRGMPLCLRGHGVPAPLSDPGWHPAPSEMGQHNWRWRYLYRT
jgi:hypothetical protein